MEKRYRVAFAQRGKGECLGCGCRLFLAIVHALALMAQRGITDKVIYSDSVNAQLWVNKKQCKTKLERTPQTEQLYQVIARAENWLRTHPVTVPIFKWETKKWGEIPADFGRKG